MRERPPEGNCIQGAVYTSGLWQFKAEGYFPLIKSFYRDFLNGDCTRPNNVTTPGASVVNLLILWGEFVFLHNNFKNT